MASPIDSLFKDKQEVTTGEPLMSPVPATTPGFDFEQKLKSAGSQDQLAFAKEHSYGANHRGQNFERYYSHPAFSRLGFNPYIDNEAKYNENTSWTGDFWRAAKQIPGMMGRAAWDNATGFFNLTADGNTESSAAMEKSMSIANSSRGGVGGFVTNLAGNSAYTFGILGEMLLEEAVMLGLDVATGGGAAAMHGPLEARHAMQLGRLGRTLSNTRDIFRSINSAQDARAFWSTAKAAGKGALDILNPLENTTRLLREGNKLAGMTDAARAANTLSDFAKMKKTAGAFYRDIRAMRAVLTESQLEGGFTETDTYDELSRQFYEKNGRLPEGKEADMIAAQSKSAGRATSFLNMPAIYLTNKIVLERAVRGIGPRAVMRELETSGFTRNIVRNKGWKELGTDPFSFAAKGFKSMTTLPYWKNLPKAIAKGSLRYSAANFAEGFQESIQEGLQVGVKNYYLNQMEHPDREGTKLNSALMWDSVAKGVNSQFSAQGAEVFASGFLMGSLVQGPKFLMNQGAKQYMKFTKPEQFKALRDQREKSENQLLDAMNDLYKDPAKYFEAITSGMTEQLDIHTLMDEVEGDAKVGRDTVDEALLKHVHTLFHAGKTDLLVDQLSSLKELSEVELKDAFGLQADDPVDLQQRIDKTISDVKDLTSRFKAVNENFTNPFDPKLYDPITEEDAYKEEALNHAGWRGAQLQAVFNRRAFDQALERMDSISNTALGNSGLEEVNALDYSLVFDEENAADEMRNLVKQVPILMQGDGEAKREGRKQQKKLEALVEFHTARDTYKKVLKEIAAVQARNEIAREKGNPEETVNEKPIKDAQKALKKAYNAYLKRITKWGTFNLDENVAKSFDQFVDFLRLSEDAQAFSTIVNQFHNPETFSRAAKVHSDVLKQMHTNRRNHIDKSLKKWLRKKAVNELVTLLTNEGIYFEPDSMYELLESNTVPSIFYDAVGHRELVKDSPKHKKALEIIDKWMQSEGRVQVPTTPVAPATPAVSPSTQLTAATEKFLKEEYARQIAADPDFITAFPLFEDWLKSSVAKAHISRLQPATTPVVPVPATPALPQTPQTAALSFEDAVLTRLLLMTELRGNSNRTKREEIVKAISKHLELVKTIPTFMSATADKQKESLVKEMRKLLQRFGLSNGVVENSTLAPNLAAIIMTELGIAVPVVQNTPVPLPPAPIVPAPQAPQAPAVQATDIPNVGDVITVISPFPDDEDFPDGFKEMKVEEVKPVRDKTGKLTGGYLRAIPTDPNDKMGSLSPISLLDTTDYHVGVKPAPAVSSTPQLVSLDQIDFTNPELVKLIKEGEPEQWMRVQESSRRNYFAHLKGGVAYKLQVVRDFLEAERKNDPEPQGFGKWRDRAQKTLEEGFNEFQSVVQDYEKYISDPNIQLDPKTIETINNLIGLLNKVFTGVSTQPEVPQPVPVPVPAVPINRTVQAVIDEVKENATFIVLGTASYDLLDKNIKPLVDKAFDVFKVKELREALDKHERENPNPDLLGQARTDIRRRFESKEYKDKWLNAHYLNLRTGAVYDRVTSVGSDGKEIGEKWGPSSTRIGNSIDGITRDFFDGKTMIWSNYRNRIPVTAENQKTLSPEVELVNKRGDKFTVNSFIKGKGNSPDKVSMKGPTGAILADLTTGEYFIVSPMLSSKDDKGNDTSEATFNSFIKDLQELKKMFDANHEQVMSSGIVLYNDQLGLAGTVDIMTVDDQGIVRIYDMKTMRQNQLTAQAVPTSDDFVYDHVYSDSKRSNRDKHTAQLSLYRILLANTHGLVAQGLAVIPIKVSYESGDVSTKEAYIIKNKEDGSLRLIDLTPLDSVEGRNINPLVLEAEPAIEPELIPEIPATPQIQQVSKNLKEQFEDIENRRIVSIKSIRHIENYNYGDDYYISDVDDPSYKGGKIGYNRDRWKLIRLIELHYQKLENEALPELKTLNKGNLIPQVGERISLFRTSPRVTGIDETKGIVYLEGSTPSMPLTEIFKDEDIQYQLLKGRRDLLIKSKIGESKPTPQIQEAQAQLEPLPVPEEPFEGAFSEEIGTPREVYTLIEEHAAITRELSGLDDKELLPPVHRNIVAVGGVTVSRKSFEDFVGKGRVTSQMSPYFKNAEEEDALSSVAASMLLEGIGNSERDNEDSIAEFILQYPAGVGAKNSKSDSTYHGSVHNRKITLRDQLKEIEKKVKQMTGVSLESIVNAESNRQKTLAPLPNTIADQVANAATLDELAQVEQGASEAFSTGDLEATGNVSSIEISEMIQEREQELAPVEEVTPQDQSLANEGYSSQVAADNIDELTKEADALTMDQLLQKMKDEKTC